MTAETFIEKKVEEWDEEFTSRVEGTYMKCLEHGFTAMNGILCCQLAKEGIRGTRNVFFSWLPLWRNEGALYLVPFHIPFTKTT